MARRFTMEWPDLKTKITAELKDADHPAICDAFWNRLPFKTIFAASMSAGEMFKVPVPFILPLAPPEKCAFFPDVPPGSIVVLPYGGIMLKYGICAEPFRLPLFATVLAEDMPSLYTVSIKLRDAYFFTKEIIIANIARAQG